MNAAKPDWTKAPELEYDLQTLGASAATATVYCRPTHAITPLRGLHYAIAIGDETPQIVDVDAKENSRAWMFNINRATAQGQTKHTLKKGAQTLKIWMVDSGRCHRQDRRRHEGVAAELRRAAADSSGSALDFQTWPC